MNINSENQQAEFVDKNSHANPNLVECTWYKDIIYFLQKLQPPDVFDKNKVRALKIKEIIYCLIDHVLYYKDPLGVILRSLDPQEAQKAMIEFHDNLCGGHHFWRTIAYNILRAGYFWPSLFNDVCANIRACVKCKKFYGKQKLKYFPLKPLVVSGPFQQWGLDFIEEIHPTSSGQHRWILTANDYFTKWIETIPTRNESHKVIISFLEDIMSRFGSPSNIVTGNVASFKHEPLINFCEKIWDYISPFYSLLPPRKWFVRFL
jgi:hypothetical protein